MIVNPNDLGRKVQIAPGKCLSSRHHGKVGTVGESPQDGRVRVSWGGHKKQLTYLPTDLQYVDVAQPASPVSACGATTAFPTTKPWTGF